MARPLWFLVALSLMAAVGCAGTAPPAPQAGAEDQPVYGGHLNWRVSNDVVNYDPSDQGRGNPGNNGLAQAYNTLLGFKSGPGVGYEEMILQPELAERWEVSPDAKTFTFHLRKGVKFANLPPANGRELTSDDVKLTMEYYGRTGEFKDKKLIPSRLKSMYEGLDKVTPPNKYTVQVSFKDPFVPFISYAGSDWNPMVPREIIDQDGHLMDRIVGTGPYQLDVAASQKGTRWVWKKNPTYWDEGKPYLDEIRWIVVPQEGTAHAAFQTKQVDALENLVAQSAQEVGRANPAAAAIMRFQSQPAFLRFSQREGSPLRDVRLRRAIALGIDRDEINRIFAGGQGDWALPWTMPGLFTKEETRQLLKHDLEEAKRQVAAAGYSGLTLELPHYRALQETDVIYQLIQAQIRRLGITVEIKIIDRPQMQAFRRAASFDLDIGTGSSTLEADPDSALYTEFHTNLIGSNNYSHISDPELDKLLQAQRGEPDQQKRRELMRSVVRRLVDQVWNLGLVYQPKWDYIQPYVKNYHLHFGNHGPHLWVWLQK